MPANVPIPVDPNDPSNFVTKITVPPSSGPVPPCTGKEFTVQVNPSTGRVSVAGPSGAGTGTGATSSNGGETTPAGTSTPIPHGEAEQGGEEPNATSTGLSANDVGVSGVSVAINQARGATNVDPAGNTTTHWQIVVTICYPPCCYTITLDGSFNADGTTNGNPTVSY